MGKLANFLPSRNGLHYANSWPHEPDLKIQTPAGQIAIGDAANGLCGGMAFAVRDLFEAHRLPPATHTNPEDDSPAFNFIVKRLIDSFNLPLGVAEYYAWMNYPTHDTWIGPEGLSHRTIGDSMPALRQTIDSGHPCPLGLVCIHSTNPGDLGQNHQVLAYGYEDDGPTTTVWVYDPNWPDRDDVTISFDHTNPDHTTTFAYSTHDHNVLGFFTVGYGAVDPSDLFEDGTTPPTGWLSPAADATLSGTVELVFEPFRDVDAVTFTAYYATDPSNIHSVGWHPIGNGVRQSNGTFTLQWNTASIPDQGNAGWGTVNLAAGSSKQGAAVNPTCYRRVSTHNGVVYHPPKALVCDCVPHPLPLNRQITVTIDAKDHTTSAPVAGTVTISLEGRLEHTGPTNKPFVFTFTTKEINARIGPPSRQRVIERTIYPVAEVTAPGYPAVAVRLDFAGVR